MTYEERDAERVIVLVSADSGVTWYPKGGDASLSQPITTPTMIRMVSADGTTWTTT